MSGFTFYEVANSIQKPLLDETPEPVPGEYLEHLREHLQINIISLNDEEMVFDLIGVSTPIANALRRIMLAEVPTVAVEDVWISANTSIIQDEVLAHRVGLIPLKIDPSLIEYRNGTDETDSDTVVFFLEASCSRPADTDEHDYVEDVLSSQLVWLPQGNQSERFPEGIRPVHDDIVIAKLKPGQRLELEAHCQKGIGKDHTKFSPVATASYRLLPDIHFLQPVTGEKAVELKEMCPMNVFDIEDLGKGRGGPTAKTARPRDCTMCRECIRKEGWSDFVQLRRKADHFIFSVESSGCIPPEEIVISAIDVLRNKATKFQQYVEEFETEM